MILLRTPNTQMVFFNQGIFFLATKGSLGTALQSALSQALGAGAFVEFKGKGNIGGVEN